MPPTSPKSSLLKRQSTVIHQSAPPADGILVECVKGKSRKGALRVKTHSIGFNSKDSLYLGQWSVLPSVPTMSVTVPNCSQNYVIRQRARKLRSGLKGHHLVDVQGLCIWYHGKFFEILWKCCCLGKCLSPPGFKSGNLYISVKFYILPFTYWFVFFQSCCLNSQFYL